MEHSSSKLLTAQFYEWERIGRGYTVSDTPAQLEPPFVPFFGHFIDKPYIDDGKQHTLLSKVKNYFVPEHVVSTPQIVKERPTAHPDDEVQPSLTINTIALPKGFKTHIEVMEQCLVMLSMVKQPVCFELIASIDSILVQIVCRDVVAAFVYTQLRAYFPECAIQETYTDELLAIVDDMVCIRMLDFGLQKEFMRPLASFSNSHHDPYTPVFGVFNTLNDYEHVVLQILFSGVHNAWAESIITSVTDERGGSFFFDAPKMPNVAKEKVSRPLFGVTVRMACFADTDEETVHTTHQCALALIHASTSPYNQLLPLGTPDYTVEQRLSDLLWRQTHRVGMLLNSRELATLVHLPSAALSKKLIRNTRTTKQAPAYLHDESYVFGINEHQGQSVEVGISIEQRLKHLHIIDATGMGKSTLLQSLIHQDIASNTGCCVLDPHGDLIDAILKIIPEERIEDVVLIDPSDSLHPIGFNILSAHTDFERELLASDLVAVFKRFSSSWGDQLHSVLANAIMTFLYNTQIGHLGDLRKFLIETSFRNTILETCTDSELVYYWHKEYPLLRTSSIGSILTRLDSFLRPKVIRNMVCQPQSIDMGALMDSNKIVLVKLSQGLIGEENSYLLGACIVAKVQQAAMARQQQVASNRTPFFYYIDEFHHFLTPSLQTILSGARKYGLGLVCVHQDMQQLSRSDSDIANALMSNVATRICFRLSDVDAKHMQDGFSGFNAEDFQNLGVGEAIARVNTADADFNLSITTLEYEGKDESDSIIEISRMKYGVAMPRPQPQQSAIPPPLPPAPITSAPAKQPKKQEPATSVETIRKHRYLQMLIKSLAEQHGYKANIEVPTADGRGQIDVLAEKGDESIAIEVSVTTSVEWEVHNIQKCLAEKHQKIVVCSTKSKKLEQIKRKINTTISQDDQKRIYLLTPDKIPTLFTTTQTLPESVTVIKGRNVRTKFDTENQSNVEDIIRRIIGIGNKPL